jgi:phosphoribosylanthranilate isomerase
LLLDSYSPGVRGGSGTTFDWSLLNGVDRRKLILSGGIDAGNIVAADAVGAYALDLSSGVEEAPGRKSPRLMQRLFRRLS